MAQITNELKQSVLSAVERQAAQIRSGRATTLTAQNLGPLNPTGARADAVVLGDFATGYDGAETVVPFTWGLSEWGGGDTWSGS
jgi:hypothetical protein